jgi:hypothetical protein
LPLELQSLFESFLAALGDPDGGETLHRLHSSDAIVRCADGMISAAEIDCREFAHAHREISLRGREALPRFARPVFLQAVPGGTDADETVAWFEIAEIREERQLVAALGLRTIEGMPRIGWATLTPRVEDWSYRDGLLHSLADYAWMQMTEPARARALIDASYFRYHWRSSVKFSSLPDASFGCQMSTVCCKHDFEISLPSEAQLVIDAMPWETLSPELSGTRLPKRADGKLQLKSLNETCRFLGSRGQCLIHQTLGRQPFGPCCIFPMAFARTPEGVAVGLSPICESTRAGIGPSLSAREEDLRERLVHAEPRQANGFRLSPATEISWEQFRDVEKSLCEILAAKELPMRHRLHVGCRLLGALHDGEPVEVDRWLGESAVAITAELRKAIHDMLIKVLGWDRATLRALPPRIPPALFGMEVGEPLIVARILQNTLFSKTYSYPFDLTTAHNFLIVLYLLALVMQDAAGGSLSDAMWRELGALGVHGLLKSVLHEGVPEGFRTVFGTAEFGLWMLAA